MDSSDSKRHSTGEIEVTRLQQPAAKLPPNSLGDGKMPEITDSDPTLFNRELLFNEGRGACLRCDSLIEIGAITRWLDERQTAVCPHCHFDAVVPVSLPLHERERIRRERSWTNIP